MYILMLKGHCGAGLFISPAYRQLVITLPAREMLKVCPEQHLKKQI